MSSRKIIDENRINWNNRNQATLSYKMIFDDRPEIDLMEAEEEKPDVDELLAENNRHWEEKLRRTQKELYQAGLKEGTERGYEQASGEIDDKLMRLQSILTEAQTEWRERQLMMDPGVIDLAFELAESILEIPVDNPDIRARMESELGPILQKMDESSKPVLWISESDKEFISRLKEEYAAPATLYIRVNEEFNPGEYKIESSRETIVHSFKTMLTDLKKSLNLPSWNQ